MHRIEIYPYGGCSKFEYDINVPLKKELLVLLMGPIFQFLFVLSIYLLKIPIDHTFFYFHWFIFLFNFLPIFPLDGGRLFHLLCSYFFSYYYSLKGVFYWSYFFYCCLWIFFLLFKFNFLILLILFVLGIQIWKEMEKGDSYYYKFLMERYCNFYSFSKQKKINCVLQMKRDFYHYTIKNHRIISERNMLHDYFSIPNISGKRKETTKISM